MKAHLLFPSFFRPIGFVLFIPGFILGFFFVFYGFIIPGFGPPIDPHAMLGWLTNYTNELALALVITGLIFIGFSRLKKEDELTAYIRLSALYWAVLANFVLFVSCMIIARLIANELPGNLFFSLTTLNLVMLLMIFIGRFYYLLHKSRNEYQAPPIRLLPNNTFSTVIKIIGACCMVVYIVMMIYSLSSTPSFSTDSPFIEYLQFIPYITPFLMIYWIFTRERVEDEYIRSVRLEAMHMAIYVSYAVLFISNLTLQSMAYDAFEQFNFCMIPLVFVLVFQYRLLRAGSTEKQNMNNGFHPTN
jgi:hypothetical protein